MATQSDILFASLMGSKVAEAVPRFEQVQNELMKQVLPPLPFLPFRGEDHIKKIQETTKKDLWRADPNIKEEQFFPFSFQWKGKKWLLPYEPLVNISSGNTIIRRNVAKAKPKHDDPLTGSIKERWNRKDYEITITGVLMGSILTGDMEHCFPREDFNTLVKVVTAPKRLRVFCEPLYLLGINYIVIEDFSFPFTKGENVQAYEIKAYSDFDYHLLLDMDD